MSNLNNIKRGPIMFALIILEESSMGSWPSFRQAV